MRLFTLFTALVSFALLPTFVSTFVVKVWQNEDCSGEPNEVLDRGSDGDCEWFEGGKSLMYQSDIGCFLGT